MFPVGRPARSPGWLVLKTPELPEGLQESIFEGHVREGSRQVGDHSCTILWLMVRLNVQGLTLPTLRRQQVWGAACSRSSGS